jgi:HPt (histidine-containing phosphotransfer) domain-containing protein
MPATDRIGAPTHLRSRFADDPDMGQIVHMFVQEMPQRVEQLSGAWARHDLSTLRRLTHQLKGSGGGYGFPAISESAGKVEELVASVISGDRAPDTAGIQQELRDLMDLCRSVSA